jgi:putative spermidine/putrescine transport system permease protein
MGLPPYAATWERIWYYGFRIFCGLVFLFLIAPIIIIVPLSFNVEPYFTFTKGMLSLDPDAYSWRWYLDIFENGMVNPDLPKFSWAWLADSWANAQWIHSTKNSWFIAVSATALATALGTLAALGLSQSQMPARNLIMSLLISPMIVPIVITSAGLFFFFSDIKLAGTYLGIILAHTVLGTPFVVITVTATLVGFDRSLIRAGQMLGAPPHTVFFKVVMPLILPGVISGALFAFITSFDEVVAVIFLADYDQRTIPRQMWSGIREQISPTILAVATILVIISIMLLTMVELLRRRSERLRGITPS